MLLIYLLIIVWLALLTHLIIAGQVGWSFVILSFIVWNLILVIWVDTSPWRET
jgi:hypothetical protein